MCAQGVEALVRQFGELEEEMVLNKIKSIFISMPKELEAYRRIWDHGETNDHRRPAHGVGEPGATANLSLLRIS